MGHVQTRAYRAGKVEDEGFALDAVSEHLDRKGTVVWVDLCDADHDASSGWPPSWAVSRWFTRPADPFP